MAIETYKRISEMVESPSQLNIDSKIPFVNDDSPTNYIISYGDLKDDLLENIQDPINKVDKITTISNNVVASHGDNLSTIIESYNQDASTYSSLQSNSDGTIEMNLDTKDGPYGIQFSEESGKETIEFRNGGTIVNVENPINSKDVANKQYVDDHIPALSFKTINEQSIEGSGNIKVQEHLVSTENIKAINGETLLGSGNLSITSSSLGLGNVNNTSDLNKPISTATQTVLDTKQNTLISGTNIKTLMNNSLLGSGNITLEELEYTRQPGVDTYALLLTTYPTPEKGWTVLVRHDETIDGIATLRQWNGTTWINLETVVYEDDIVTQEELTQRAYNNDVYSIEGGYYFKGSEGEIGRVNAADLSILTNNTAWRVVRKNVIKGKRYTFFFPKTSASNTVGVICACDDTGTILSVINTGQVGAGEYYSISLIPQVNVIALSLNFNYANKPYFIVDEALEVKKSFETIATANEVNCVLNNQVFDKTHFTQIIGQPNYFGALINFRASRLYFEGFAPVSMVLYSDYAPLTQYGIKAITGASIIQESANKWYVDLSAESAKMIGVNFNRVEVPSVKVYYSESLENNQLVITEKLYNITGGYKFAGREGKIGYVSQSNLAIITNNPAYRLVYLKVIQGKRYYFKFAATPTQSNVAVICKCDADGNIISSMMAGTNGTAGTYYEVNVIPQSDIIAVTINIAYQNKPYFRIDEENELIKSFRSEATANEVAFNFVNQAFSRTTFQQIIGQVNFWGGVLNFRPKKLYFKGSAPSTIILYSDYLPVTKNGVKYYDTFTNEGNGIWSIDLTAETGVKMVALNFNYASATPPTTFDIFYQDSVKYRLNGLDAKTDTTNVAVQQLNDRLTEAIENMEGGIPNVILKDFYALGASSTEGTVTGNVSWVDKLAAKVAFNSVHKLAIGGSTILYNSERVNLIDQITNIPANSEGLITLMIGANDILLSHDMGDADAALALPSNQLNNTTNVAIAYRYAIETIISKCPKAIILELQLNPMQGYDAKVTELAEIKRKICNQYGIMIIETFLECGINALNWSTYQIDEIHPNLDGQERIAMYMKGEFLRFMF